MKQNHFYSVKTRISKKQRLFAQMFIKNDSKNELKLMLFFVQFKTTNKPK